MSNFQIICLICDKRDGTLRRIRPHKIYCCAGCVKTHNGIDYIAANIEQFKAEFRARHYPPTTRMQIASLTDRKEPVL